MKVKPVIMAGGAGTRLWPLSRETYPKQFIKIFDGKSLLQKAVLRNIHFGNPAIIVGEDHRFIAKEQLEEIGIKAEIIVEPIGKNTAPVAALSTIIAAGSYDAVVLLPADHYIKDDMEYKACIMRAIDLTADYDVVTIGIAPTKPHTGYGYIQLGDKISENSFNSRKFVEKPNLELARDYLSSGNYCWNSGIFIYNPEKMRNIVQKYIPETFEQVRKSYENSVEDLSFKKLKDEFYSKIEGDSIDYAIMEKITDIAVVKSSFGWSDLGSFSSIYEVMEKDKDKNVASSDSIFVESSQNYVLSNKLTALVGVKNLVVISTEDALLVSALDESEKVKDVVKKLNNEERLEAKFSTICYRPWGSYETIDEGMLHKVKRIIVKPGHKLSLQYHNKRAEHWVVVKGRAEVLVGDIEKTLHENDSIYIPIGQKHRLSNPAGEELHLIEVQTGTYLGEDDIVRLEDVYGRSPK